MADLLRLTSQLPALAPGTYEVIKVTPRKYVRVWVSANDGDSPNSIFFEDEFTLRLLLL
jgi:hypothetical protein